MTMASARRRMAASPSSSPPTNNQTIAIIAIAILALSSPIHAFSCSSPRTAKIVCHPLSLPRSPLPTSSTRLHARHQPLHPTKGGIVVEAKSDFVARDVLIDGFMGRDDGDGNFGGSEAGAGGQQQAGNDVDDFDVAPNDYGFTSMSSATRQPKRQEFPIRPQQPKRQPPQQQTQPPRQPQQQAQPQQRQGPVPPNSPPPPMAQQQQQPQQQQQAPPPTRKSKLPDPSLMKISDIQGELNLRRVSTSDCFDRISLENKLREARAAMAAAGSMDRNSRRNAGGDGGVIGSASVIDRAPPPPPKVRQQSQPQRTRTASPPRSSAAEQAIFTSSTTAYSNTAQSTPNRRSANTNTQTRTSAPSAPGNPFARANRTPEQAQKHGGNSSSSFRDASRGIGFGDANSYTAGTMGQPGQGGVSAGYSGGGHSGGGDGVSLGNKRTSYGEFGNSVGNFESSGAGSNSGSSSTGANSGRSVGNVGGSSSSFRSGGGGVSGGGGTSTFSSSSSGGGGRGGGSSSFSAGGVSIKGDSSIFSSMGSIGQGGGTNVFSSGGAGGAPAASAGPRTPPPSNVNRPRPAPPAPVVPMEEPPEQLDWLVQDSINTDSDYSTNEYTPETTTSDYSDTSYDNDIINDNPPQYNIDTNTNDYDLSGERMSQQYQNQGLDMLSGGQDGFGVVQGLTRAGGDSSHRGSADDVKAESGVVGDAGVTMGGDFGGGGGASGRQSARYSQPGQYED